MAESMEVKNVQNRVNHIVSEWRTLGVAMLETEKRISTTKSGAEWISGLIERHGDNIFATELVK